MKMPEKPTPAPYNRYKVERQADGTYKVINHSDYAGGSDSIYYTQRNEGKFVIVESRAPSGYYGDWTDANAPGTAGSVLGKRAYAFEITKSLDGQTIWLGNADYNADITTTNSGGTLIDTGEGAVTITFGSRNADKTYATDPTGIANNENSYTMHANADKMQNDRVLGNILLTKVDLDAARYLAAGSNGDTTLEGAVYDLYAADTIEHPDGVSGIVDYSKITDDAVSILSAYRKDNYDNATLKYDFSAEGQAIANMYESSNETVNAYNATLTADGDYANGKGNGWMPTDQPAEYRLAEMFTNDEGIFRVEGLPYGQYLVVETTIPKDVFQCDPFIVTVDANSPQSRFTVPAGSATIRYLQEQRNAERVTITKEIQRLGKQNHNLERLRTTGCIDSAQYWERRAVIEQQLIEKKALLMRRFFNKNVEKVLRQTKGISTRLAAGPPLTDFDEAAFTALVSRVKISSTAITFGLINGMKLPEGRTEP